RQEFVIGGYKPGTSGFESLLIGYYDDDRKLHYAAKLRSGFTPHSRADLFRRMADHALHRCPFADPPNSEGRTHWGQGITADDMTRLRWVKPALVVEAAFVEWTRDGLLRHPKFVGIREDKNAAAVMREGT